MQENTLVAVCGIYGLDVIVQTLKSINAFEITCALARSLLGLPARGAPSSRSSFERRRDACRYNGVVLHSKLSTGQFPRANELIAKLERIKHEEHTKSQAKATLEAAS
uniref:Tis11B-like protein N-terminal domain-containing protein n=2 Tax=Calcidiscus leptoporus TaxID=127549 RepID=A0A6U5HZR3_9EUKA|mmetsp:Transcript_35914/g.83861  ORF Transcript_35914/g.83861 Transcript_35914/m.83861 type:complete len:108 (+) Transcript_35914:624-947(+)